MRQAGLKIWKDSVWGATMVILRLIFVFSSRTRIIFYDPVPRHCGFILASNHISHFDPPLITTNFPRPIDWIAMVELFKGRFFRSLFTELNVIPVDRNGSDRTALRTAVRRLAANRVVGIFPEGGIRDGDSSIVNGAKMKQGVALLSVLSDAPILPCVILGSDRLYHSRRWLPWNRATVWVGCGRMIYPPAKLSGDDKRKYIQTAYAEEILRLTQLLKRDFQLTETDFPHSPQQRMAGQ